MNPSAIYSKSGKGVQEASGKTSLLARSDRSVLAAFDGRATLGEVAQKCGKSFDAAFEQVVSKLDRDGFIREVISGVPSSGAPRPQAKPAAPKPAAPAAPAEPAEDLDFSALSVPASKPAAAAPPPPKPTAQAAADAERRAQEQASTLAKARQEAEARLQRDRDRLKGETEAKLRSEMEAKLRAEAAGKGQADLEARMRAEADAKVKAAREAAVRAAAEAKAKAEAEMKAKLEEERKKAEAERLAREETERKAREAEERTRKEAEEKARREAEELKKRLEEERKRAEAERKAREEAERKAREEAERARKEAEEKARAEAEALRKQLEEERRKLEAERKARAEEDERRKRADEENERKRRAEEETAQKRRDAEEAEAKRAAQEKASAAVAAAAAETTPRAAVPPPPPAPAAPAENFDDNLLADLDSFDKRDEEEHKAKEEAERQARAAAERRAREQRDEENERRKRAEDSERAARQAAEQAQREEDARRAREEEDRKEQERRTKELLAAAAAKRTQAPAPAAQDDDIGVTDDDLDMDDVKQDERVLSATAKRDARQREAATAEAPVAYSSRRPIKWGKLVVTLVVVAVVGGLAWVHIMPVPVAEYEKAASSALGRPVKIGSARFSLFTGIQLRFQNVSVGNDVKLAAVRASPQASALFGPRKAFNRIDVDGVTMPESTLGAVLFGKHKPDAFSVRRLVVHDLKLGAPLVLPPMDADFTFADDGALQTAVLTGPEGLLARLTPKASEVEFDMTATRFALPMAPDVSLNQFAMKGTASARGIKVDSWDGALFEGRFAGAAELKWGQNWEVQGPITVRGINAAVFAPALLSEGKADGSGRYTMSGSNPEKLMDAAHVEGNFTITKGTLGNIDLSRAIQTSGRQWSGRTQFNEMTGQGVYDKGGVALRNLTIAAGALNAGASLDVAQSGALSGRIVADVKTASQTVRATLNLGGTAKEPQVRN